MKRLLYTAIVFAGFCTSLWATSPKREMRAAWLTTVWRIDWPSTTIPAYGDPEARKLAIDHQKKEFISILQSLQEAHVNTVFFQVRTMCDALYRSSYEPWSQYISSSRGADPGYDPLAFAIEEAHKRGMELHAWLNPYRYSASYATHGNLATDYASTKPEWLLNYGEYIKILNPGIPEVMQRITDIVAEIVSNYDVDGITFDDYFYFYRSADIKNNKTELKTTDAMDQAQYDAYNPDKLSRADWRRENCNKMIASVYKKIQELKPYVRFGVSPAGVAASSPSVAAKYGVVPSPVGSDWQYGRIYSDPLAWVSRGTLDYISPQIYWTTYHGSNPYGPLASWWSYVSNTFGRHFYSSHSLTGMTASTKGLSTRGEEIPLEGLSSIEQLAASGNGMAAREKRRISTRASFTFDELGLQIDHNRNSDRNGAPGSVFFATKKTIQAPFLNYLKKNKFTHPSLVPAITWKEAKEQGLVESLNLSDTTLSWTYPESNVRYVVYAVPKANSNENFLFASSQYLLGISYAKHYSLPAGITASSHKIAVSVLDRYGNEFSVRVLGEDMETGGSITLSYPADNSNPLLPCLFKWEGLSGVDSYLWEVAYDPEFKKRIYARETTETQFFSGLEAGMKENTTYYWRVRAQKANTTAISSAVCRFSGKDFSITSPANASEEVDLNARIAWDKIAPTAEYTLEISRSESFKPQEEVFRKKTNENYLDLPQNTLINGSIYYARVSAKFSVFSALSKVSSFRTKKMPVPIPQIISPEAGSQINSSELKVSWKKQYAKGFRVELSTDMEFAPLATHIKQSNASNYSVVYKKLKPDTYYLRVIAKDDDGLDKISETRSIEIKGTSNLQGNQAEFSNWSLHATRKNCLLYAPNLQEAKTVDLSLYSLQGKLLRQSKLNLQHGENRITIETENIPKGPYVIKITDGKALRIFKFIK